MDLNGARIDRDIPDADVVLADLGARTTQRLLALSGWQVQKSRPVQLLCRPGRALVVRRSVTAVRGNETRAFSVVHEARTRPIESVDSETGGRTIPVPVLRESRHRRSWVFPYDPYLPDLVEVLSVEGARGIADPVVGFPSSVRSSAVRYRPGRRAVIRFEVRPRGRLGGTPHVFFLKVLRPAAADRVVANASMLGSVDRRFVVPVVCPSPGTVVFREAHGRRLRSVMLNPTDPTPVRVEDLIGVASTLAAMPSDGLARKSSPRRRLSRAIRMLSSSVPQLEARVGGLEERIHAVLDRTDQPSVPVHGDLYEGQVLVDRGGSIISILDTDGLGVGDALMDAANVAAHLGALAETHPHLSARLDGIRTRSLVAAERAFGGTPESLAAREAIAGLQLATGPLRVMDPNWVRRTEARVARAEEAFRVHAVRR
jgi:hypothetical protein